MCSKMCAVFLTILLSIITTSPLAHAQLGLGGILGGLGPIAGPILGPILGQPIRPPVGQVPPIVPPVGQVPPIVPPIVPPVGGQVVNITILGSLSCSVPGSNVPGPGVSGVNVTIICGNTTIAQASTNSQGIINVSVMTTTSVLSGNTCIARIPLPIANCTLTPNTGTLVAPVILIGNLIQDLVGLTFAAIFGILTSLATVTLS
ncbi:hypothetical protein MTR67_040831 [Solanum verrucosum]|uniref:Uncharacterized protein n=1 Tax=Solanum verrucosum TaxID=315347 RepID=A0AAF0ZQ62_SOLVR|nr:hypothetical protein MTR67_040831 [Solanum verrucosum]